MVVVIRTLTFGDAAVAVAVAIISAVATGLYTPSCMTAVYNEARRAPCIFRFHVASEGGWDIGGTVGAIVAAALSALGLPLEAAILLGLPMVFVQAVLLDRSYSVVSREHRVMGPVPEDGHAGFTAVTEGA
jgi:hypothetical protein